MHSLGIVQWNSTRRDHLGNPGGVSGSGPVSRARPCLLMERARQCKLWSRSSSMLTDGKSSSV